MSLDVDVWAATQADLAHTKPSESHHQFKTKQQASLAPASCQNSNLTHPSLPSPPPPSQNTYRQQCTPPIPTTNPTAPPPSTKRTTPHHTLSTPPHLHQTTPQHQRTTIPHLTPAAPRPPRTSITPSLPTFYNRSKCHMSRETRMTSRGLSPPILRWQRMISTQNDSRKESVRWCCSPRPQQVPRHLCTTCFSKLAFRRLCNLSAKMHANGIKGAVEAFAAFSWLMLRKIRES